MKFRQLTKPSHDLLKWLFKNAVVAGAVGGIAFAILSPFISPVLTSWQAGTGTLVDEPKIEVDIDGPPERLTANESGEYMLWVRNTQQRIAEDVRITLYFKGCPTNRGFLSGSYAEGRYPGVKFHSNDCFETIYIPNIVRGEELAFEYTVEGRHESNLPKGLLISSGIHSDFGYKVEYVWRLNGMAFAEIDSENMNISGGYK